MHDIIDYALNLFIKQIRYGLVARIHRSHGKRRCGRGSIPRDGNLFLRFRLQWLIVDMMNCTGADLST